MSLFVKLAGQLPPFQKAFFRNFIALIFMFAVLLRQKVGFRPNKGSVPGLIGAAFLARLPALQLLRHRAVKPFRRQYAQQAFAVFFYFVFGPVVQGKTKFGLRLHAGNFFRRFGLF